MSVLFSVWSLLQAGEGTGLRGTTVFLWKLFGAVRRLVRDAHIVITFFNVRNANEVKHGEVLYPGSPVSHCSRAHTQEPTPPGVTFRGAGQVCEGGLGLGKQPRAEGSLDPWREQPRAGVWIQRPEGDARLCTLWELPGHFPCSCLGCLICVGGRAGRACTGSASRCQGGLYT